MEHVFENNFLWDEYNSLSSRKIWEKQRDLVLIMAGNLDLPKVLYELNGLPLIVHIVKSALHIDSTSIIYIIVGKYRQQIEKVINEHFMKSDYIRYINQPEPLGTGHAIQCCLPVLQQYFSSSKVLILSGDMPFFSTHSMREVMNNQFAATIVATHMEEPFGYGRIIQSHQHSHQHSHQQSHPSAFRIVEEKDCTDEEKLVKLVNCGIYAFENGFLCKNLPKINNNNAQQEYYLTSIFSGGEEGKIGIFEMEEMRFKTI